MHRVIRLAPIGVYVLFTKFLRETINFLTNQKKEIEEEQVKEREGFQKAIEKSQAENSQLKQKVDELNGLYQKKRLEMNSEIDAYNEKFKLEYKNASEGYKKLLLNKKELNDSIFSQKIERKKNEVFR